MAKAEGGAHCEPPMSSREACSPHQALRLDSSLSLLVLTLILLASCSFPGSVPRTVKIGLSAPFEGLYRDLGYEALYAARFAVRQRNEGGALGGRYLVELVALNDFGEPEEARLQAAEMAVDPAVLGVVGGLTRRSAESARLEYERLGLAFLTPDTDPRRLAERAARVAAQNLHALHTVILRGESEVDAALAAAFLEAFQSQGGSILSEKALAGDSPMPESLSISLSQADLLFISADAPTSASWISQAREAGFGGTILGGPDIGSPLVVDIAGEASDGVLFVSSLGTGPVDGAFLDGYRALSGGVTPGPVAAWTYASASRVLDAMNAATGTRGRPSRGGVSAILGAQPAGLPAISVYMIREGNIYTPTGY